jgi:hypothetical protein
LSFSCQIPSIHDVSYILNVLYNKAGASQTNNFSVIPSNCEGQPSPLDSRFTDLGNVIGSYYPESPFEFVPGTNQNAALELLANTDPLLVPFPDNSNSEYLLLQRYVLMLHYLDTNGDMWTGGKWLEDEAASMTCDWSGVTCDDSGYVDILNRTYYTVKMELFFAARKCF